MSEHTQHISESTFLWMLGGLFGVICLIVVGWFSIQSFSGNTPASSVHEPVDDTVLVDAYNNSLATLIETTPLTVQDVEDWLFSVRVPASLREVHLTRARSWATFAATHPDEIMIREWFIRNE